VNGVPAEQAEAVAVAWRMHDWQAHPAIRVGGVLMRDELAGPHRGPRRVFWLLDEGVQLIYEPFGWIDEWYVDVVCIQARRDDGQLVYHVTDEYADIIVEGMGPAYRMIDLDQLADAMSAASIDTARGRRGPPVRAAFRRPVLAPGRAVPAAADPWLLRIGSPLSAAAASGRKRRRAGPARPGKIRGQHRPL